MRSPFPGMDPYLEDPTIWPDFHMSLSAELKKGLNKILPKGYRARLERFVWVHEPEGNERVLLGKPDTYVIEGGRTPPGGAAVSERAAAPSSVLLPATEQEGSRYVKIIDPKRLRVVTVVEVLSPSNKMPGIKRDAYLMKRNEFFGSGINVIELDLLRTGLRMPMEPVPSADADYYILVSRAMEYPRAGIWRLSSRDSLPDIPIPLDPDVEEPMLSLQRCFDETFEFGPDEMDIDYDQPPIPPLKDEDAEWARERVREWKKGNSTHRV